MMRRLHRFRLAGYPLLIVTGALTLTSVGLGGMADRGQQLPRPGTTSRKTVEPLPGLALDLKVKSVEESATGGFVSLSLDTASSLPFDRLQLSMRLPAGVIFADGSKERTWEIGLDAGERSVIPADLLVGRPGLFDLTAKVTGSRDGRTIRRATACRLAIGERRLRPQVRDGAIEYRGRSDNKGNGR